MEVAVKVFVRSSTVKYLPDGFLSGEMIWRVTRLLCTVEKLFSHMVMSDSFLRSLRVTRSRICDGPGGN